MGADHDVIVVGGGHTGVPAAAYLGRAGMRVLLLERRTHLGGAAVSHAPFAGRPERVSRYAYLVSLLPTSIARDLGIDVELRTRRVSACAPHEGGCLLVDDDALSDRTAGSFAALAGGAGVRDHAAWLGFYAMT